MTTAFGKLSSVGGCCVKIGLGIILFFALTAVHKLGVQWQKDVNNVDIYTIQDPRFWGPMTMLVPQNCTVLNGLISSRNDSAATSLLMMSELGEAPATVATNILGHPIIPAQDVVAMVAVQKCGHNITALDVTWSQWYWAAIFTATSDFDIEAMHSSRMNMFWFFVFSSALSFLVEFGESGGKAAMAVADAQQPPQPELPLMAKICQAGCTQGIKKISTLMQQLGFASLFVTYWHEDHYLMNYFPGRAIVLSYCFTTLPMLFLLPATLVLGPENPVVQGLMGCVGCCSLILCCPVSLPVIGWSFYNLQFLYTLFTGEYSNEVAFSASFPSMAKAVGSASKHLVGFNVVDGIMATLADVAPVLAREPEEEAGNLSGYIAQEPLLKEQP